MKLKMKFGIFRTCSTLEWNSRGAGSKLRSNLESWHSDCIGHYEASFMPPRAACLERADQIPNRFSAERLNGFSNGMDLTKLTTCSPKTPNKVGHAAREFLNSASSPWWQTVRFKPSALLYL